MSFLLFFIILCKLFIGYTELYEQFNINSFIVDSLYILFVFFLVRCFASKKIRPTLYAGISILVGMILIACVVYKRFYGVIPTYHTLLLVNQTTEITASISSLLNWKDFYYIADMIILPFIIFSELKLSKKRKDIRFSKKTIGITSLCFMLAISTFVYTMNKKDILNDKKKSEKMGVFSYNLSFPFSKVFPVNKAYSMENKKITNEMIREIKKEKPVENPEYKGVAKDKNVIILQLESLQENVVGLKVNGKSITPNLDRLREQSLSFSTFFQQTGKGNTVDAEWSVNTSTYPGTYELNSNRFADREVPSLPRVLKEHGYVTNTFHTNDAKFYNRKQLYQALGFDKFYDQKYFGNKDVIDIAASDHVLYEKTLPVLKKLDEKDKKFYAHIIALSSHHPFKIPKDKQPLPLPKELEGTQFGDYIQAVNYVDRELGFLIEGLKREGLWEKSLFVVYGDHHIIDTNSLPDNLKQYLPASHVKNGQFDPYRIPFMIYYPELKEGKDFKNIGSEIDIMPTVMNLLGIQPKDQVMFGQDLLNQKDNIIPQRFYFPDGTFIHEKYCYIPGESFEGGQAINLEGMLVPLEANVKDDFEKTRKLLNLSDQYLENLPIRKGKARDS
ncbi:sulfatase [Bacillus pseudomycoides]|uniref:Sulfatase n=2 Tax=Bacillus TaxID=1386 RepID=A0AA91V8P6_9BACI|nr:MULTISPECIES: LTA synthase family protein [Bacillus]PEB55357.1 sulfatase [Bacillus sp. AFS098217]PED80103.1 sulfatase [Bacillus pseudomycoides]PEU12527.1 sulfatase [Bacillus sp. AFS019443]PEU22484.1 sulfatase [Bacillus sp. AFS014408]PFW60587.1 sulfatase [Bacillus sp. AFS075034]